MITKLRKTALVAGAFAVATVLTSCIRLDMDIELESGTASGEMVFAVSQEMLDLAGGDASDVLEGSDPPEGATAEPYEEDGYVGEKYTFEDVALDEISEGEGFEITYDAEAGRYEVLGEMDFSEDGEMAGMPAEMGDMMAQSFDVSVSITFPGEVIEHTGELDGNTVTWTPQFGEVTEISAVAEEGGGGGMSTLWIALAAVAVVAAGVLAFLFLRGRSGSGSGAADGTPEPGAPGEMPAAGTAGQSGSGDTGSN